MNRGYAQGMFARRPSFPLVATAVFGLVALLLTGWTGGLSESLIGPQEGGHYVNALFVGDWIRAGMPSPMAFARDYYAHFPRLSIGHWPPGWYLIQSPLFALVRPSPYGALVIAAIVAGLPAGAIVWAFERMQRRLLGLLMAMAYLFLPLVLEGARFLLLDQPVTLIVACAAISWVRASDDPRPGRVLLFAVFAALAPLTDASGALIALVPAIDIALTRRWNLLRQPMLWGGAVLALAMAAPWYGFASTLPADAAAPAQTALSLAAGGHALMANLGFVGIALAMGGAFSAWRAPEVPEMRIARLSVAVVLAALILQIAAPAAFAPRSIAPLLPWAMVLAGLGLLNLWRLHRVASYATAPAALALMLPALAGLWTLSAKPDLGAPALGRTMAREGGLWLVDGRSGSEGALIAATAYADDGAKRVWISRASQWLSTSDFMGGNYRLAAHNPDEAAAILERLGAGGIVTARERNAYAYPHSRLLGRAVEGDGFTSAEWAFARGDGSVLIARRNLPMTPNLALVEGNGGSTSARRMTAALR